MDELEFALAKRAEAAVGMLVSGKPSIPARAKAFVEAAVEIARARDPQTAMAALQRSPNEIAKALADAHTTLDYVWSGESGSAVLSAFVASIGEPDLLGALAQFGSAIPRGATRVLIASGATGDVVAEGFPKLIRRLDFALGEDLMLRKTVSAVVVSSELLAMTGTAGRALFEAELGKGLVRATNAAILASLVDSDTTEIAAGADPLASLRAGLLAAGPSSGYVVAAPAGQVAWLATHEANRGGMGVRGGLLAPGVIVVAIDDATSMTVIAAERLAVFDGGTELRPAGHAVVDMSDTPQSVGSKVSLWQTGCVGLLVERAWRVDGDTSGVVVVA